MYMVLVIWPTDPYNHDHRIVGLTGNHEGARDGPRTFSGLLDLWLGQQLDGLLWFELESNLAVIMIVRFGANIPALFDIAW